MNLQNTKIRLQESSMYFPESTPYLMNLDLSHIRMWEKLLPHVLGRPDIRNGVPDIR